VLALLSGAYPSPLPAQELRSSIGRDFWLAFPPTDRTGSGKLAVYISAEQDATVSVEGRRRDGSADRRTLTVPAGTVREVGFDLDDYELRSASYPSGSTGDCERAAPQSVHLISDADVSVYAVVRQQFTSDAWMVLPTPSLGLDYRIMSYASDYVPGSFFVPANYYPSQFVVLATENNTKVDITLNLSRTRVANGSTRSVVLQQGQAYLVQAFVSGSSQHEDLTSTRVRADKPVVVLGGHYRAQVPLIADGASRDMLVEQMQSTDVWGKRYVVPPLKLAADAVQDGSQDVVVIRVLTNVDSTWVSVDGLPNFLLVRAGNIWEMPLSRGRTIEATQPVMVGVFDRSAKRSGNVNYTGDPSLMIVPPVEQYLSKYRTINVEPTSFGVPVYTQHQITVFGPMGATGLQVDGAPIPALTQIGTSGYGYAHVDVRSGAHVSEALLDPVADTTAEFGILIYGYGPAESYGYTGGMAFEKLYQPTIWLRVVDCQGAPGDSVRVVAVVDSITEQPSFDALSVRELRGTITFNSTTLVPAPFHAPDWTAINASVGGVDFAHRFDSLRVGDTVARLQMRAALGNADVDSLRLENLTWHDVDGGAVSISDQSANGQFILLGVCDKNGKRLFDPSGVAQQTTRYFNMLGEEVLPSSDPQLLIAVQPGAGLPRLMYGRPQ
jgi:hypothetical protein